MHRSEARRDVVGRVVRVVDLAREAVRARLDEARAHADRAAAAREAQEYQNVILVESRVLLLLWSTVLGCVFGLLFFSNCAAN